MIESDFLYNPTDSFRHCHCPTILETQSGDLLVAWYAYPDQEHIGARLVLSRRPKGQSGWNKSEFINLRENSSVGNPVICQEPSGRIWLFYVVLKGGYWDTAVLRGTCSEDEGRTWNESFQVWEKPGMMVRHHPLILNNLSMLLPAYDESKRNSVILTSQPPYQNWKETYRFSDLELIQPVLVQEEEGRMSMFFRPWNSPRVIWRSHSNLEHSWSVPMRTPLPNPLSGISAFVVGKSIGVIHNHTNEHKRSPLSISMTHDGGTTWQEPRHIDSNDHEVSYPSFITGCNGHVHGVYTYNRRFIKYVSFKKEDFLPGS